MNNSKPSICVIEIPPHVIPAKAGIQVLSLSFKKLFKAWIPVRRRTGPPGRTFASGMTSTGFTYVEMLVALAVMSVIVMCAQQSFMVISKRFDGLSQSSLSDAERAFTLLVLAQDLRCAFFSTDDENSLFIGRPAAGKERPQLEFSRTASRKKFKTLRVRYFMEREKGSQLFKLWREEAGTKTLLCRDILKFHLRYLDESHWVESWGWDPFEERLLDGIRGLPIAVSVELLRQNDQNPQEPVVMPIMTAVINATRAG